MLPPGSTDTVLSGALLRGVLLRGVLLLAMSALYGCSSLAGIAPKGAPTATRATSPPVGAPLGAIPTTGALPSTQTAPSPELQARYATLLTRLQAGDTVAPTDLAQFSAENPGLAGPLLNLGLAEARAGDEVAARTLLERASTVCSSCGPVWNELAILDRRQGQFAAAEQGYLRAIELEPGFAPAYYNLAVLYELYISRPDLALENYEHFLQLAGTSAEGQDVEKWAADLRRRVGATPKSARAEGPT